MATEIDCACGFCGTKMVWKSGYPQDEYGEDGILAILFCPKCGSTGLVCQKKDLNSMSAYGKEVKTL